MKKLLAAIILALMVSGTGSAYAVSRDQARANDHVLIGTNHDFEEWYKRDAGSKGFGQGHNNYIFTTSAVVNAPPPGKCLVITGNSEQTVAVWCNDGTR